MIAWIRIVATPWFGKTSASGSVTVGDVPDGTYLLSVWHPALSAEPVAERIEIRGNANILRQLDVEAVDQLRSAAGAPK